MVGERDVGEDVLDDCEERQHDVPGEELLRAVEGHLSLVQQERSLRQAVGLFLDGLVVELLRDESGPAHVVLDLEARVVQVGCVDQESSDVLGDVELTELCAGVTVPATTVSLRDFSVSMPALWMAMSVAKMASMIPLRCVSWAWVRRTVPPCRKMRACWPCSGGSGWS